MEYAHGMSAADTACPRCLTISWSIGDDRHAHLIHQTDTHLYENIAGPSRPALCGVTFTRPPYTAPTLDVTGDPNCGICGGSGQVFGAVCTCVPVAASDIAQTRTELANTLIDAADQLDDHDQPPDWRDDFIGPSGLIALTGGLSPSQQQLTDLFDAIKDADILSTDQVAELDDLPITRPNTVQPITQTPGAPVDDLMDLIPYADPTVAYGDYASAPPLPDKQSPTSFVVDWCNTIGIPAAQVGQWVWIKFASRPLKTVAKRLRDAGFFYSPQREVWRHAGGKRSGRSTLPTRSLIQSFDTTKCEDA